MIHLGTFDPSETVVIPFSTNDGSGGAVGFSATIEAADFDIYKDGSATQRSSTAGFTVSETFDSVTGLHQLTIDLTDDTDAGFYAVGSQYAVALTPDETVDSQTIAVWLAVFRIEASLNPASGLVQSAASAGASAVDLPGSLNLDDGSVVHVYAGTGAGTSFVVRDYSTPSATTIWGTLAAALGTDSAFRSLPGPPGDALLAMLVDDATRIDASSVNAVEGKVDTVDTVADDIKAKTDSLTFTVAGQVDANTQSLNDTALTGDGVSPKFGV